MSGLQWGRDLGREECWISGSKGRRKQVEEGEYCREMTREGKEGVQNKKRKGKKRKRNVGQEAKK